MEKENKKNEKNKEMVESLNNVSKGTMWNTSLTISNGSVKIKVVLEIDSWPTD